MGEPDQAEGEDQGLVLPPPEPGQADRERRAVGDVVELCSGAGAAKVARVNGGSLGVLSVPRAHNCVASFCDNAVRVRKSPVRDAWDFGSPPFPSSLAVGDFNHDGKLDMAVVSGDGRTISSTRRS